LFFRGSFVTIVIKHLGITQTKITKFSTMYQSI